METGKSMKDLALFPHNKLLWNPATAEAMAHRDVMDYAITNEFFRIRDEVYADLCRLLHHND